MLNPYFPDESSINLVTDSYLVGMLRDAIEAEKQLAVRKAALTREIAARCAEREARRLETIHGYATPYRSQVASFNWRGAIEQLVDERNIPIPAVLDALAANCSTSESALGVRFTPF
jgi:hypothetical protein